MSWVAVAIGGAGLISGVVGASKQAGAQKDATNEANRNSAQQELTRWVTMLGPEKGLQLFRALNPKAAELLGRRGGMDDQQKQRITDIDAEIAAIESDKSGRNMFGQATQGAAKARQQAVAKLKAEKDGILKAAGGQQGLLDEDLIKDLPPGLADQYAGLADNAAEQAAGNLSRYDSETAGMTQQARDIEGMAKRFGQGRLANLKEETEREREGLDRRAISSLTSRGIAAGSAMTDALAGNSDQTRRQYNAARAGIEDQQINLQTGLATGTLGVASSRLSGRNALILGGQANEQQLRTGGINAQHSALSGTQPYYVGGSDPTAAALMTAGAGATGYTSPLVGYAYRNWMTNQNSNPYASAPAYGGQYADAGGVGPPAIPTN